MAQEIKLKEESERSFVVRGKGEVFLKIDRDHSDIIISSLSAFSFEL